MNPYEITRLPYMLSARVKDRQVNLVDILTGILENNTEGIKSINYYRILYTNESMEV